MNLCKPAALSLAFVLWALSPAVNAEIASEEEQRLHQIYQDFLAQPISDSQWRALFSSPSQEDFYVVQPGDTLWELSLVFFGDGHYWPKLWSVNSELTNPHLIRPGAQIRFFRGPGSLLPQVSVQSPSGGSMQLTETGEPVRSKPRFAGDQDLITQNASGDSVYLLKDAPEIPPSQFPERPLLKNLTGTFPEEQRRMDFDDVGFSFEGRPSTDLTPLVSLKSFVTDETLDFTGEVVEHTGTNEQSSTLQYIYVRAEEPYGVGDRLLALGRSSRAGSIFSRNHIYHIYGEIEITETTGSDPDLFRAIVLESQSGVPTGAKLVKQSLPRFDFSTDGRVSQIPAQIMDAHREPFRDLYGLGTEIYLDRGEADGLQVGDILYITEDRRQRLSRPKVIHPPVYSAVAKVVHTGQQVATGVLVQSYDDIRQGDVTGVSTQPSEIYPVLEERDAIQIIE